MSEREQEKQDDALLRALRELPRPSMEATGGAWGPRTHAAAKAAFARAHSPEPWHGRFAATFGRAAVPVGLAAIVALYLTWAFSAASAIVH